MKVERHILAKDRPAVCLDAFILDDSPEYRSGESKPAVLICPGGGYLRCSDREADPIALRFLARGYHAFVLRYSTKESGGGRFPSFLEDAARAMCFIRDRAATQHIAGDKIAVCGFSAGANLAGLLATRWHEGFLSTALGRPNSDFKPAALISAYGMLDWPALMALAAEDPEAEKKEPWGSKMDLWRECNQTVFGTQNPSQEQMTEASPAHKVSAQTPPAFIWHTASDGLVYPQLSINFTSAMLAHKRSCELHLFENGGHGLSLADKTSSGSQWQMDTRASAWMELCIDWLDTRLFPNMM